MAVNQITFLAILGVKMGLASINPTTEITTDDIYEAVIACDELAHLTSSEVEFVIAFAECSDTQAEHAPKYFGKYFDDYKRQHQLFMTSHWIDADCSYLEACYSFFYS